MHGEWEWREEGEGVKWDEGGGLSASSRLTWSRGHNLRDAFDEAGRNGYYSSENRSRSLNQEYSLTAQYKFGENTWITLGGNLNGQLNEVFSKSYGIEDITGKDEWNWFLMPEFRFQHSRGNDRFALSASGFSNTPSASRMRPVLDIGNPSRLSVGNIYLKPYSQTFLSANWTRNNREKFSTLMMYVFSQIYSHRITSALWYDGDGILYSIPVNANYEEDSYRLVMGRYVLFGVKWNFGKMNAAHSARAQQAALDMIF